MHRRLDQPIVFVPALIVVAIVGVWWFAFRSDDNATASSTTTKQVVDVTKGSMSETVSAEGTVAAADTDDLSFASSGTVTAVNVKAGDTVKAGQVLATIDSAELQAAVASAEADVADAQAKLSDDRSSSASDAQISADESSVASANDALANAREALAGASLVATFDGTVSAVNLTVGEELASGGTGGNSPTGSDSGSDQSASNLGSDNGANGSDSSDNSSSAQIQVVSTGRFTVDLAVDSSDIDGVAVGQTATVTRSTSSSSKSAIPGGLGRFFGSNGAQGPAANSSSNSGDSTSSSGTATDGTQATGTVTAVGKIADASSGVATYPVTISFDASGDDFYVGSTVTGDIATNTRENVVQVSSLAVTTTNGVSTVTVATDGTTTGPTETRTVTTGLVANGNTEITSGLKAGEKVIITITRPTGNGTFSPPAGGGPQGFEGGPPGAITKSGG
jgi:multidrug efflux pump subunit AcrA (membrane-fusion protein)